MSEDKKCPNCNGEGGFSDGMCGRCKGSGLDNGDPEDGWTDPPFTPVSLNPELDLERAGRLFYAPESADADDIDWLMEHEDASPWDFQ
jgi:hypothetical protein